MTTLITGGTGKTGGRLAKLIHAAGHPFLIASRSGTAPEPFKAIKFDWFDPSTFEIPFKADPKIDKVYLIAPTGVLDLLPLVKPFIDLALSKGVKRFVLLTATLSEPGGPGLGKIHEYVASLDVEYTVFRPTWFIENFGALYAHGIRENNEISSVTKNGRIPLIGADDIAKAAFDALFAEKSPNTDYYLVGPELFSYDEVATLFTEVLGRRITHKHLTDEEEQALFQSFGLSEEYAAMLNAGEGVVASGSEEAFVGTNKTVTGTYTLRQFIEANKQIWIKS
ncbi:hypothetical protein NLJ89_g5172 [Agrocybe chaxingu]|uniref:Agroclavine dehydrogenase n=1 Tax=Agrocybe chaxingu TaxID=84603 RepID=A0A9W8K8N8_9AGAR|nr:hypothetical protein NLJ89_g5172 [Agrocybe chaxingu]